ncbi:hypothetical protein IP80_03310 [beta proteobacterium AAP65]|nr:hypothetical protein IP80_03310 [beta proteobacterium AAP65]
MGLSAFALAPLASAAIVTGNWDPALPQGSFPGLGWTATINLKISDDCRQGAQSLPFIVNLFGRSFGCNENPFDSSSRFSILSAEVGIYDLNTFVIKDVLRFNPSSFSPLLLNLDPGVSISYLLSLTDSNPVQGTIDATDNFEFRLSLPGDAPALKYRAFGSSGGFITAPERPTETGYAVNDDSAQAAVLATTRLEKGQAVFNAVPEPGSLLLALLALAAAGAAAGGSARRRTGQVPALQAA